MRRQTISTKELAAILGVTPQKIGAWVRRGLPTEGRNGSYQFAPDRVERWLIKAGIAERQEEDELPKILRTRKECGNHFGVHPDTVSDWHATPGFPGRAASSAGNARDGYYPISEIEQWLANRRGAKSGAVEEERAKLLAVQRQERELRLAKQRGELISVAEVATFMARVVTQAGAMIDEIPDRVMAQIPGRVKNRPAIRRDLVGLTKDLRALMQELAEGDQDEQDDTAAEGMEGSMEEA